MAARRIRLLPALLVPALLVGCTSSPGASPAGPATQAAPLTPVPSPAESRPPREAPMTPIPSGDANPPVTGEVPPDVMAAAQADLATRVGAEKAAGATVVVAQSVTWPDGSLGCPKPGMMYTQMVVPGYQVVLEVDGAQYDYRSGRTGGATLCEGGGRPGAPAAGG